MDGLSNDIPIRCRCCGFSFRLHSSKRPISVLCPSCGNAFVYERSELRVPSGESPQFPSEEKIATKTPTDASDRPKGRWEILFLTVCLQIVILISFPICLYYQSKIASKNNPAADSLVERPAQHSAGPAVEHPIKHNENDGDKVGKSNGTDGIVSKSATPPSVSATVQPPTARDKNVPQTPRVEKSESVTETRVAPAKAPEKKEAAPTSAPVKTPEKKEAAPTSAPVKTPEKKEATPTSTPAKTPEKKEATPTAAPVKTTEKKEPVTEVVPPKTPEKKSATASAPAKTPRKKSATASAPAKTPEKEAAPVGDPAKVPEKKPTPEKTPTDVPLIPVDETPPATSRELQSVFDMFSNRPVPSRTETPKIEEAAPTKTETPKIAGAAPIPKANHLFSSYETELTSAKAKLDSAVAMLSIDPEKSLAESIESVKMYEKLGQSVPPVAYWIIAQAYATQSWGETLIEGSRPIESMAVSSDSHWLLTQCRDNTIWIWDIFRSQNTIEGFKLDSGENAFVKLLFTPDFRLAVGGETNGTIRIWDTTQKNPAETVVTLQSKVPGLRDLQVSPDGRWLVACGGSDSQIASGPDRMTAPIQTSSVPTPQGIGSQTSAFPLPGSVPYGANGSAFGAPVDTKPEPGRIILVNFRNRNDKNEDAAAAWDDLNVIWLWDLNLLQNGVVPQPILLRGHEKPVRIMQISSDSKWLVTGSDDATARVYNLKGAYPGADQAVLKGHQLGITAITIAPNGKWVATGSRDNTIRLWTLPDSQVVSGSAILTGHLGWISTLAADSNGERLVSGSYDQTVRIWQIPDGRVDNASQRNCEVIQSDQGAVHQVLLSKDGKMLISLGGDASLRIRGLESAFDSRHGVLIRNRNLPISKVALTPDNRWLIFNYTNLRDPANCGVRLWPVRLNDLMESASEFKN